MDGINRNEPQPVSANEQPAEIGARLFAALFEPGDYILLRPVETWVEDGRKRSRVDFKRQAYCPAKTSGMERWVQIQLDHSEQERTNVFFGVCPRLGTKGRYDLAWQIRTVRALWCDIDHVSVQEAQSRITKSGVPEPSIIVNSGNGVHVYWKLNEPYLIDDVGEPPRVEIEWIELAGGKKKPRKHIVEDGERVYLDERKHISRLSGKAEHLQDVLAGIAQVIGGDHTTDLSRLLRVPGSLNRKDQRNGTEPVPTELVVCDPDRRYPLSDFEPFKSPSPETEKGKKIAVMPLPAVRKLTANKSDALSNLIARSEIAEAGCRSEADFAVCCYAIRNGVGKEDVWSRVEAIGKFAEGGRRYFDVTWENAEYEVRSAKYEELRKPSKSSVKKETGPPHGPDEPDSEGDRDGNRKPMIVVDPSETPVGETLSQVTDQLLSAGNCYSRAEQMVAVHNDAVSPILSSAELAGLLNQYVEFYFIKDNEGEYKPIPSVYANTWLNHRIERDRLPTIKLFTHNPVYTDDWRLVAPGFDIASGIFYAGPPVEPRDGTTHLDALLRDFCFESSADRTNYIGMLLTTLLVPRFIGSKPAVIFNGNQPELGKSILAQIIAILRDGRCTETASFNPNDEEFEKRLGAIVHRGATTIIIDNAKARARTPRIDSPCLERSITDPILSYRLLGQSASIRAENSHIFCLTANSAQVSRDLVTRSVVVNLHHEGNPQRRTFSIADPEGYAEDHRLELLGELIGMVERWKAAGMPKANVHTRFNKKGWGTLVGGILSVCGQPEFLANADEAATTLDETRREFTELVASLVEHPQGIWTAAELVEHCGREGLLKEELGEGSTRSKSTRLGVIAGRYVGERFSLSDGRAATFHRSKNRNGALYRVGVDNEVRNL